MLKKICLGRFAPPLIAFAWLDLVRHNAKRVLRGVGFNQNPFSGYAQLGFDEEAVKLFCQLQKEGIIYNYVTYASVLTAISGLAAYEHGRQVHSHVLRFQLPSYVVLQNSLIDMYSKCGNLTYSRRIFDNMSERTVITWNAMLVGYSKHGRGQDVIKLFELRMEENKILPDKVTFLALLSGCSHGGMENRGLEFFDEMVSGETCVQPDIEHYGTVDLLGRAGQIEKAFNFVKDMPFETTGAAQQPQIVLKYNDTLAEVKLNMETQAISFF